MRLGFLLFEAELSDPFATFLIIATLFKIESHIDSWSFFPREGSYLKEFFRFVFLRVFMRSRSVRSCSPAFLRSRCRHGLRDLHLGRNLSSERLHKNPRNYV